MKKFIRIITIITALTLCLFALSTLTACEKITPEEEAAVGHYDLIQIEGLIIDEIEITAEDYDYNYLILNSDKTFNIKNSFNNIESSSKGKWSLNNQTLTLKLSGLFSRKETHTLTENTITMTATSENAQITLTFIKSIQG